MKKIATLLVAAALAVCGTAADIGYRYLGKIETSSPAFLSVQKFPNQPEFLLLSEFGALISGKVSVIPNIKEIVNTKNFAAAKTDTLYANFKWPNNIETIPQDVFGPGIDAIVVPDGFLPPGKTEGNIYIMTVSQNDVTQDAKIIQISPHKEGYYYHFGYWIDMDGDGLKDYLTARSNSQPGQGELVWFKQPADGISSGGLWEEHFICNGPEVMFDVQ